MRQITRLTFHIIKMRKSKMGYFSCLAKCIKRRGGDKKVSTFFLSPLMPSHLSEQYCPVWADMKQN